MNDCDQLAVAAIVHTGHGMVDRLLADLVHDLHGRGWRVHGMVQEAVVLNNRCSQRMVLVDVNDGTRFPISQNLGPGSDSCSIDPGGVAAASVVLRRALVEGADLIIVNRFGKLEVNGGGFAAEMLEVMSSGMPLLTVVAEKYLDDWRRFTGGIADELPPHRQALDAWVSNLFLSKRKTA